MSVNALKLAAIIGMLQAAAKCKTCLDSRVVLGQLLDMPGDESAWEACPDCCPDGYFPCDATGGEKHG